MGEFSPLSLNDLVLGGGPIGMLVALVAKNKGGRVIISEVNPVRIAFSSEQIPTIALKFKDYHSFATSNLEQIYGEKNLENALHYQATTFASVFIENQGDGNFEVQSLPALAQISNINDMLVDDVDKDGHLDIILAGNLYDSEIETPRNDASLGLVLKGNGQGDFSPLEVAKSGLYLAGNIKSLTFIQWEDGQKAILAGVNDGVIQCSILNN